MDSQLTKKHLFIIGGVVLLSIYYCCLFYVARLWYSNIPEEVSRLINSWMYTVLVPTAYVVVPAHLLGVSIMAYNRVVNAGQVVLLFMVPVGVAYLFFSPI